MIWSRYTSSNLGIDTPKSLRTSLSRIAFSDVTTLTPLHAAIELASTLRSTHRRLLIVTGRSSNFASQTHCHELKDIVGKYRTMNLDTRTIGDVASSMIISSSVAAAVVLQAATGRIDRERGLM